MSREPCNNIATNLQSKEALQRAIEYWETFKQEAAELLEYGEFEDALKLQAEMCETALAALRSELSRLNPEPLMVAGWEVGKLLGIVAIMEKHNIEPKDLKNLCDNIGWCMELVRKEMSQMLEKELIQAKEEM
jgi:hypothetical protein